MPHNINGKNITKLQLVKQSRLYVISITMVLLCPVVWASVCCFLSCLFCVIICQIEPFQYMYSVLLCRLHCFAGPRLDRFP